MQVEFALESAADWLRDAQGIFPLQWEELSTEKEKIPAITPDTERYLELDRLGMLHCVTVRYQGHLVGYYIAAVIGHLHYKDAGLMAHTDLYYLLPEFRTGGTGAKMLIFLESTLKARRVVKIYASTKAHSDHGELFEALGYKLTDRIFTKYIGA